jgi:hypothetical protein
MARNERGCVGHASGFLGTAAAQGDGGKTGGRRRHRNGKFPAACLAKARGDARSEGGVSRAHGSRAADVEQKTATFAASKWERTECSSDRYCGWHRPFVIDRKEKS